MHTPRRSRALILLVAATAFAASSVHACLTHDILGLPRPTDIWTASSAAITFPIAGSVSAAITITDPAITSWRINAAGTKAFSANPAIHTLVSNITADVTAVAYDASNVYLRTSGVPSHAVGPFPGNPAYPADQNRTARIPRAPQVQNGPKTAAGLGNIGVMVNGVAFFNPRDAATYLNQGVWQQNANVFEASSFDTGRGHPAPGQGMPTPGQPLPGNYHYHQAPLALLDQLDPANTGQHHSPIIGFAFDGFPLYGPYGFASPDATGGIVRQTSSYQLRNISQRTTLPNSAAAAFPGPDVSPQYPLGSYIQDFLYVPGSGTLDQYNGRFTVTPDYPDGTYAYFLSLDATGTSVYPYLIGPQYYGIVDTANTAPGSAITIPPDAVYYTAPVPEPASAAFLASALFPTFTRRRNLRAGS